MRGHVLFPQYLQPVSRFFRERRNRRLGDMIDQAAHRKGARIEVLDIGGSLIFWETIAEPARAKCNVSIINLPDAYDETLHKEADLKDGCTLLTGDARDLSRFADGSFDLIVCNSVIEHVGSWMDMVAAATEARRVGQRGWVQVPAFEFPIEQHFLLPFVHWFADPIQVKVLSLFHGVSKHRSVTERYDSVQHIRPLTRNQLAVLFPGTAIQSEWLGFPKSHIAIW